MIFNTDEIVRDIRIDFEKALDFVTGEQARAATADQIERGLFQLLISLGFKLLGLFFAQRARACSRDALRLKDGQALPYHRDGKREYVSIFGKLDIWRPYFYKKGLGGQSPLDGELSLGDDCYSDLVREVSEYLGVYSVYHKASDILERLLGLHLSSRAMEENIAADARDVEAYYTQKTPPTPEQEAEILVIQADGKGVPMVMEADETPQPRLGKGQKRGRKKEAVVTAVYTTARSPRSPQTVVDSFFGATPHLETPATAAPRSAPQNKHIWATLEGKDVALRRLSQQVARRQGDHIQEQVALCDGCEALQTRLATCFPGFTQVLDFIHAAEYLWDAANALLGETHPQRTAWMKQHTLRLLQGQAADLIAEFRRLTQSAETSAAQRAQLVKTANYLERNLPYLDYPTYLANGWPIASGVIEGACRHFVKDRCELSGMRWTQAGAENLLSLRAAAENGDWDAYHIFRKRRRHTRLYCAPFPGSRSPEAQALAA